jgi:hypothetical protein
MYERPIKYGLLNYKLPRIVFHLAEKRQAKTQHRPDHHLQTWSGSTGSFS